MNSLTCDIIRQLLLRHLCADQDLQQVQQQTLVHTDYQETVPGQGDSIQKWGLGHLKEGQKQADQGYNEEK